MPFARENWTLWGTPNCGKGQPMQTMGMGHGACRAFPRRQIGRRFAKSEQCLRLVNISPQAGRESRFRG